MLKPFTRSKLNITGIRQGKALAEKLRGIDFETCYCSPQTRAKQYCEIIYKGSPVQDHRLAEIICGEFEGMEEDREMPEAAALAFQKGDRGTERFDLFVKRNCDFCDFIMERHMGGNIMVVAHAWNTRIINYYIKGKPSDYDFHKRVVESGGFITLNIR